MLAIGSPQHGLDGVSRRAFLRLGGWGVLGLSAAEQRARAEASGKGLRRCIFLLLNGGASPFETFDPKAGARRDVGGPFRAIATATPGVQVSETLPLLAQRSSKFVLLRSLCHDAAPLHETGLQLIQTGRLVRGDVMPPSVGSIVARLLGPRNDWPAYAVLPRPLGDNGSAIWQGQWAGSLGEAYDPWFVDGVPASQPLDDRGVARRGGSAVDVDRRSLVRTWLEMPDAERRPYGDSELARSCLAARRLVERGVRLVTINMFDTLAERVTWDCHANGAWA